MDDAAKKTALKMIPYGIYIMTAEAEDGALKPVDALRQTYLLATEA